MSVRGIVGATDMEGEAACKTLSDDLLEKIIAMMPFPAIFKARFLSKSWLARLSSVSARNDNALTKGLATAFQRQVAERSNNWGTFLSVFNSKKDFLGYNLASQTLEKLPDLSFLPGFLPSFARLRQHMQIEGALLWIFFPKTSRGDSELYVANILTRSWKCVRQCPRSPNAGSLRCSKLIIDTSSQTYKVILLSRDDILNRLYIQIYDSKTDAWTIDLFEDIPEWGPTSAALLNGVLYMVANSRPEELLGYKLEDRTLGRWPLLFLESHDLTIFANVPRLRPPPDIQAINLLVYEGDLVMIVSFSVVKRWSPDNFCFMDFENDPDKGYEEKTQLVMRVDLQSGIPKFREDLAWGPPAGDLNVMKVSRQPFIDGNCIVLGKERIGRLVLQYNIDEDEWTTIEPPKKYNWLDCCFKPGVNPFIAV